MRKRDTETPRASDPVVDRALAFYKERSEALKQQRMNELADLVFEAGDHWDPKVKSDRLAAGKPVVEIDLLSGPLNQIEGQAQEARAGINISANKPGTAPTAAGLLQGFTRNIEQQSNALDVYQHAVRRCSRAGTGGWRLLPEYESDDSFDQVLRIKWVDNWHTVYLGEAKEQDGSDRTQALIVDDLTYDQYRARYGDSDLAESLGSRMQSLGDAPPEWLKSDRVRVAEYFEIKVQKRTRLKLSNGQQYHEVYEDELETGPQTRDKGKFAKGAPIIPPGWKEVARRTVHEKTCCRYFINAIEVLEENTWNIPFIPIVEIEGERRNIDGQLDRRGIVRMGKQLNQLADFHETAIVEEIDIARTAPWLYEWTQIEGFEHIWKHPKGQIGLPYRKVSGDNGAPIPPPVRNLGEPAIQASVIAAQRSEQLLRAVTGVPDVFAEEKRPEQSGRAILARQRQQEQGNSKYLVSRNCGIAFTGKIILAWVASVYDTPRAHRVKGADEKEHTIVTYKGDDQRAFAEGLATQLGVKPDALVDLAHAAKYDVAVTTGKAYPTQRAENAELIMGAIQAFPPIAEKALPIVFRNTEGPGMQELAAAMEPNKGQQQIPPQVQQRLVQLDQFAQMATDKIKELQASLDANQAQIDSNERIKVEEIKSRERIAAAQEETKRLIAAAQAEIDALNELKRQAHELGMASMQAVHEDDAEQRAAALAQQQAERGHEQALELQANTPQTGAEA